MKVKQIADVINDILKVEIGEQTTLLKEDLSNVVEVGTSVENALSYDNYVNALVNRIGKMVFNDRKYRGKMLSVLKDNWEYGSIMCEINSSLPDSSVNESWQLENGTSYDTNVFRAPKAVKSKFFNSIDTYEVQQSITDMQVKQSFTSAYELNAFVEMIFTKIENRLTLDVENLIKRTINNFIGETIYDSYGSEGLATKSTSKAVNLLYLYNTLHGTTLTADKCLTDKEFIRFATYTMNKYVDVLQEYSTLFNIEHLQEFTPKEKLHCVLLSDFKRASDVYLQSDVRHNELTTLPLTDVVNNWQGTGLTYAFNDISKINVKTASGHDVEVGGILGVMFDDLALGVSLENKRVKTNYVAKSEFTNYYYKEDARYYNNFSHNFVVFFVA